MPKDPESEIPKPEEFGTGLRTHLERTRSGETHEEAAPPEAPPDAAAELAAEEQALEQRRRELADRREQIAAVETTLRVREQRISEVRARLADEERRLSAAEAELTNPGEEAETLPKHVRKLLRERAERQPELVWGAFEAGLTATDVDGKPDVAARIAAARALLAEAYGALEPAAEQADDAPDELEPLRKRRRDIKH